MTYLMDCGFFWILCGAGIAFVIWGYKNEDKLIAFEDKVWARLRKLFRKERFEREISSLNRKNKKRRALGGNRAHGTMKNEQHYYSSSPRKSQMKERIK